jgi:GNAT superfamily N-acetyltransferase
MTPHRELIDTVRNRRPDDFEIRHMASCSIEEYIGIPSAFEVRHTLKLAAPGAPPLPLQHRPASASYHKDYDAIPGNHPRDWPSKFAINRAHCLAAYILHRHVGSALLIAEPNDVSGLGGDPHLALLWDIRVAPDVRGVGIGRALLGAVEEKARATGAIGIAVETQDNNLAACQLYAAAGYAIADIDSAAYPAFPDETRLVWTKSFAPRRLDG